jgi:hypothetical protein
VVGEVFDGAGRRAALQVRGGGEEARREVAELASDQRVGAGASDAQREVDAVAHEVHHLVREQHPRAHRRKPRAKPHERRREQRPSEVWRRGDDDLSAGRVGLLGRGGDGAFDLCDVRGDLGEQGLSFGRGLDRARASNEQREAHLRLERAHRSAHVRFIEPQLLRRAGEALLLRDHLKDPHRVERDCCHRATVLRDGARLWTTRALGSRRAPRQPLSCADR